MIKSSWKGGIMQEQLGNHIHLFFNEKLFVDYYVSNKLKPIKNKTVGKENFVDIVVNYDLKNNSPVCVQRVNLRQGFYYEINFENAYQYLYYPNANNFSKMELYLLSIVKLFFKDTAQDLVEFLKELKCMSDDSLKDLELCFNSCKKNLLKKKLKAKKTT